MTKKDAPNDEAVGEYARRALDFLMRAELKGSEVPDFVRVTAWLGDMAEQADKGAGGRR